MYKKIPSPRQQKAAKAIFQNLAKDNPASIGAVLKSVGFGTGLQAHPKRVLESQGFKQAVRDLGLTEEFITNSLVKDITAKPANRIQELKLGAEILGMVKREETDDKPKVNNTYINIFNAETQEKVKQIEAEIKKVLINAETNKTPLATNEERL